MKISHYAVERPIFTSMVTCIVLVLGFVSLSHLPIDLMPDITYPTISVQTTYKDASPEEIEELVTRPIEESLSALPSVEKMSSGSFEGSSRIRVSYSWGTDINEAASDVRDRLERVYARLPEEAQRPSLRKYDLASFPILILGASSDLDPIQVRKIIEDQVKYRIERVPGVAALEVRGGLNREVHINLDVNKIKAIGLSLNQVLDRLRLGKIVCNR